VNARNRFGDQLGEETARGEDSMGDITIEGKVVHVNNAKISPESSHPVDGWSVNV
jgi:hypothetical protein